MKKVTIRRMKRKPLRRPLTNLLRKASQDRRNRNQRRRSRLPRDPRPRKANNTNLRRMATGCTNRKIKR